MSKIELYPDQREALEKLYSGALLCGGTGSGKTYTSLFFYKEKYFTRPLYVITTAKKRDDKDWQNESENIGIKNITVDSWNNIEKYKDVENAFFIFDEQRVVGYGKWAKTFIKISRHNAWILATATPADTWMDYIPVFIANGYYKNKSEFIQKHVEFNPYVKFPQVKRYHGIKELERNRDRTLVLMENVKHTKPIRKFVKIEHDNELYMRVRKDRWNPYTDAPIQNNPEYHYLLRKTASDNDYRKWYTSYLIDLHDKIIIFYNFDHELETLREVCEDSGKVYTEWNGHKHEPVPNEDRWVYLTQYSAGAEAWNCIETNAMLFYTPNYSYRMTKQAEGRIDRRNTPFIELEYFYFISDTIEKDIIQALRKKKNFNRDAWSRRRGIEWENQPSKRI